MRAARAVADEHDRTVTDNVAERLTETLDAAVVDPGAAQLLRTGRLTSGLRHVGFGVVDESGEPAALVAIATAHTTRTARTVRVGRAGRATATVTPTKPTKPPAELRARADESADTPADRRAAARRRMELRDQADQADAELGEAEAERVRAGAELDANEHHVQDMRAAVERLAEELQNARRELRQAQSRTARLERALTQATRAEAAARRRRDAAHARLEQLEDGTR